MDSIDIFGDIDLFSGQPSPGLAVDQAQKQYAPASSSFPSMPSIPETPYGHFTSASYHPTAIAVSPISYSSPSSGRRSSSGYPSPMSSLSEQSHFSFNRGSPMRPAPGQSNLAYQLATQSQMVPNDYIAAQSGSPMATSPIFTGSPNPAASPEEFFPLSPQYSHFQPSHNGYNYNQEQELSRQFESQPIAMQHDVPFPTPDIFSNGTEGASPIPIQRPVRRTSMSSSHPRGMPPYSRGSSMTFSPKSESPSSLTYGSLQGGSYTTTPTMSVGFSPEQISAAQAILQFITDRPGESIPSHLINEQLVELSGGRGYCLIGNCRTELAKQRCNPESVQGKDIIASKRADHLYDHIRDKHFNCRPFQCGQCTRAFSREHDLKRHETVHSPTVSYCPMCPRSYTRDDNLKRHVSLKHERVLTQAVGQLHLESPAG